jgi:hypothetical protein
MTYTHFVNGEYIQLTEEQHIKLVGQQESVENIIRAERDSLIAETDVWALSDRTMTAEQTAYRQALRDIPAQAGFPVNVTWPTKP